jgi:hypothetical protein
VTPLTFPAIQEAGAPSRDDIQQRPSHSDLLHEQPAPLTALAWPDETPASFDAIIVPASRGTDHLRNTVDLSAALGIQLIVLCSLATRALDVAECAARTPGSQVVAIDVPADYQHPILPKRTAEGRFQLASAGRTSDLSLKRNLGLLLARMNGWGKVLFLDDDIDSRMGMGGLGLATVRQLEAKLDSRQVAGLVCRDFPDNSVVCHARRLAGRTQDNFITGGALGINCSDQPLPFFPNIYNEDWFFFSRHAANRELAKAGEARQEPYDPYADPCRARREEFGDLLAEGLYALFDGQSTEMTDFSDRLAEADAGYWKNFIRARRDDLEETARRLEGSLESEAGKALVSLAAARDQLSQLTWRLCIDFLKAWQADLSDWERVTQTLNQPGGRLTALRRLGLTAVEPLGLLDVG